MYKKLLANDGDFMNEFKVHLNYKQFCNLLQSKTALMAAISKHKQQKD